jgi:putative sterol carrier protein
MFFGTTAWFTAFVDGLNTDSEYEKAAARYEGTMTIVAEIKGLPRPVCIWLDPYHGKVRDWTFLNNPTDKPADYVLTAGYDVWKAICRGKQDVMKGIMAGRIKVKGKMMQLLKQTRPALALVKVMLKLPTEFPDEAFYRGA